MQTRFTDLFAIRHPVMQAPIGSAAGPELAAAVCNAGALGSVTGWSMRPAQLGSVVKAAREATSHAFAVNLRADLKQDAHMAVALEHGARAIHLFWGDPTPHAADIRRGGARLIVTVSDADETKQALDAGADVLMAQGWEAGGHVRGALGTLSLVPTVVDLAGPVPVLAAGGIVDGRGLAAALMLGAAGVVVGTRFVATDESRAHPDYKAALVGARQADAVYVESLFDGGWSAAPHRVLRNSTVRAWEAAGRPAPGQRPGEGDIVGTRADGSPLRRYGAPHPTLGMSGDMEALALYAGQGVERVNEVLPASAVVERIVQEAQARLQARGG